MIAPLAPLAIGGVGGSGTRLVARLAASLGFSAGTDLNGANDNLWYTLLFKHPEVPDLAPESFTVRANIFVAAMTGHRVLDDDERALVRALAAADRPQHPACWLQQRAETLLQAASERRPPPASWAWKEPNTHVHLPQWRVVLPELRYVHVVRNGLDMAFSPNQNQRDLWGHWLLGRPVDGTPRDSLAYWCAAHRRAAEMAHEMGPDFFWLDFERLCRDPEPGLADLADFLGASREDALELRELVGMPESIGRARGEPLEQFDPADLDYLRAIGHLH